VRKVIVWQDDFHSSPHQGNMYFQTAFVLLKLCIIWYQRDL